MRSPIVSLSIVSVLCGALALAGCSGDGGGGTIPRQKFVDANVALRAVPDTLPTTDSLRVAVLRKLRVTDQELRAYLRRNGNDTELMAAVWKEVADSLQKRDSVMLAKQGKPMPNPAARVDPEDASHFPPPTRIGEPPPGQPGAETATIQPQGGPASAPVRPETASIPRPPVDARPTPVPPRPRPPTPATTQPPREMVRQVPPQTKAEIPPPPPPPPAQP